MLQGVQRKWLQLLYCICNHFLCTPCIKFSMLACHIFHSYWQQKEETNEVNYISRSTNTYLHKSQIPLGCLPYTVCWYSNNRARKLFEFLICMLYWFEMVSINRKILFIHQTWKIPEIRNPFYPFIQNPFVTIRNWASQVPDPWIKIVLCSNIEPIQCITFFRLDTVNENFWNQVFT